MTRRNEVASMARESGMFTADNMCTTVSIDVADRFAALVAAAERERCVNKCDAISDDFSKRYGDFNGEELGADTCAEVIRALSDEVMP